MKQLFYWAVEHRALLRILLILAVMAVGLLTAEMSGVVLAEDGDGFDP
ncbi:MAG: hypothetical protein HY528_02015 [Chloroflexi bacterium]|nr:hypothetical protein [Chloroflexota bacterium]